MAHKTGFTARTLNQLLGEAGFAEIAMVRFLEERFIELSEVEKVAAG